MQLEGKHRGEAQISVDRVLQWSFNRLTPENQHLLTQVSVLRRAFSAEVATALVTETIKPSVSDADLDDLERRSLLQALPERNQQGQRVFRLQPCIQEFVQKRANDLTPAHERAITYFWNHRKTKFATEDTQAAVAEYEEAFYHQCQLKRYSEAAATVFACDSFLQRRSYYQILVDLYSQLHTNWQPTLEQRQDYAAVCNNLGGAYDSLGQYQQTIDFYRRSSEIQRQIGDRKGEANSLNNLGGAYYSLGQYQQAIEFLQQSLEIMRQISDRMGEALSLSGLGNAYGSFGQGQQAIAFHQQSLEINRQIGNRNGEAISLWNLGCLYQRRGRIRKGHKCKVAAVKTWQSLNLPADAILPPHISKHRFRHLEQQGKNWTESFIQAKEWLVWLKYVLFEAIFLIALLITLPLYLFQQFKASFVFWFVAGLVIVVIIWRLQQ
ncbi:MAG: tetratricopeptide repeat protein [Leptolyngbyaceae cyanobacterium SM1_4_3]|nr:tetratricopeptide repeat protein [Leptolyngbyaceae cyanobacterium SM1_4_3]